MDPTRRRILSRVIGIAGLSAVSTTQAAGAADCSATIDANAEADDGGPFLEIPREGFTFTGTSTCDPGAELSVQVRSTDSSSPYLKTLDATVETDGSWRVSHEFAQGGFSVEVWVRAPNGDILVEVPGRLGPEAGEKTATPTPTETEPNTPTRTQTDPDTSTPTEVPPPTPRIELETQDPVAARMVRFYGGDSTAAGDRSIVTYEWETLGITSTGEWFYVEFPGDGTHPVTLRVVDSAGASQTTTMTVDVDSPDGATVFTNSERDDGTPIVEIPIDERTIRGTSMYDAGTELRIYMGSVSTADVDFDLRTTATTDENGDWSVEIDSDYELAEYVNSMMFITVSQNDKRVSPPVGAKFVDDEAAVSTTTSTPTATATHTPSSASETTSTTLRTQSATELTTAETTATPMTATGSDSLSTTTGETVTETDTDNPTSAADGPGFTVTGGLASLGGVGYLLARRLGVADEDSE